MPPRLARYAGAKGHRGIGRGACEEHSGGALGGAVPLRKGLHSPRCVEGSVLAPTLNCRQPKKGDCGAGGATGTPGANFVIQTLPEVLCVFREFF